MNSGGAPFNGFMIDSIGEPTADLRSDIAAEARIRANSGSTWNNRSHR